MTGQAHPLDEATQQSIHDRSVIDHLVETFHSARGIHAPQQAKTPKIYDQIRREWPFELTLGTRG